MITIGFVDIEKGREDGRKFVEARKLARASAESGLSRNAVLKCAVAEQCDPAKNGVGASGDAVPKQSGHRVENLDENV